MTDTPLSMTGASGLIPEFVRDNHETFVAFIRAYVEWTEKNLRLSNLHRVRDVDASVDEFLDGFSSEYLSGFPESLAVSSTGAKVDKRLLIKNIRKFYKSKGTEASYQFLFRVLYDTSVEFYYPRSDILRASDGKWVRDRSIRTTQSNGVRLYEAINSRIRQVDSATGTILASGTVERVELYRSEGIEVAEFFLSAIDGEFVPGEPIEFDAVDSVVRESTVYGVLSPLSVVNGGQGYKVGDIVRVSDSPGYRYEYTYSEPAPPGSYTVTIESASAEGASLESPVVATTEDAASSSPSNGVATPTVAVVERVDSNGSIKKLRVQTFGIRYDATRALSFVAESESGSGAEFSATVSALVRYPGVYVSNDGHLSSNKRMQDNRYYQTYSYVLRTSLTIDKYREAVKRIIHPAGLAFFGQVLVKRCKRAELRQLCSVLGLGLPYIGNYAPYGLGTKDNLAEWFIGPDGLPAGFDPALHGPVMQSSGLNPISAAARFVPSDSPLSESGHGAGDPFWRVAHHPNVSTSGAYDVRVPVSMKDDVLDWPEWQASGDERAVWHSSFNEPNSNRPAKMVYTRESEFRKMPVGSVTTPINQRGSR